jgi:hypothetical protein
MDDDDATISIIHVTRIAGMFGSALSQLQQKTIIAPGG